MISPLLSIIIPIYNVERYIKDCLESIVHQSAFEKCEVICVNDCSPDNSESIIKEYCDKYSNVTLVSHNKNKKAGAARNTGVMYAKGEYVWFVDGDDFIKDDALLIILEKLSTIKVDVFCFNHFIWTESNNYVENAFKDLNSIRGETFLLETWGNAIIYNLGYPCRAIYRKSLIDENDIKFIENVIYGEETTFMVEVICKAQSVSSTKKALYFYRQTENSSTGFLERQWKGQQIYESIFVAGNLIVKFLDKVKNKSELHSKIDKGMPWFVNRLFFRLLRANNEERNAFFGLLSHSSESELNSIVQYMNFKNKCICLYPHLMECIFPILVIGYRIVKMKDKL